MASEECIQDQSRYRERSVALQHAMELLSGKWKFSLLLTLYNYGAMRFKDLQELEDNLLITRTVNTTKPITVSYAITPHALEAEPVINALIAFGLTHRNVLLANTDASAQT
jgi:DNA-binding HxlR family transcriptional regulator